jgi:hypothetical protein
MPPFMAFDPYAGLTPFDEKGFLEGQVAYLEQQLAAVRNRLAEIGGQAAEE